MKAIEENSGERTEAAELVARIVAGDPAAEAELIETYSRGVLCLLRQQTGNRDLADDLHQETFCVALERLRAGELEQPDSLAAFLRSIARNLALAHYRKRARRRTDEDSESVERASQMRASQFSRMRRLEEAQLVRQVLEELSTERDRQILFRFYIAEDEKAEICNDLNLSSLHFNRVLFRARQRFRDLLERWEMKHRGSAGALLPALLLVSWWLG